MKALVLTGFGGLENLVFTKHTEAKKTGDCTKKTKPRFRGRVPGFANWVEL